MDVDMLKEMLKLQCVLLLPSVLKVQTIAINIHI